MSYCSRLEVTYDLSNRQIQQQTSRQLFHFVTDRGQAPSQHGNKDPHENSSQIVRNGQSHFFRSEEMYNHEHIREPLTHTWIQVSYRPPRMNQHSICDAMHPGSCHAILCHATSFSCKVHPYVALSGPATVSLSITGGSIEACRMADPGWGGRTIEYWVASVRVLWGWFVS